MDKYTSASATQRGPKKWQLRLSFKNAQGKRDAISKTVNGVGRREAKNMAEEWRREMNEMADMAPSVSKDKTIEEVVRNYLTIQLNSGELERTSYDREVVYLNNYIKPYIGNISFYTATRESLMIWLTELNKRGLSQNTICNGYYLLRKVYNYYLELGEIKNNPFLGVKKPKKGDVKITHLTEEQMKQYLNAVFDAFEPSDRQFPAFLLMFYTGLRRGEVAGLRWRDLNLKDGTISVETSIGETNKGTYTKQPKTKSSIRSFPLVPQLIEALTQRATAVEVKPEFFVCGKGITYYHPATMDRDFRKWVEEYGLVDAYGKRLTPHMLRHNIASVGIKAKMDIASLSKMMGHSSRAMTLDVYGDASKDAMKIATDKLGEEFGK